MHTTEEARKTWCPYSRLSADKESTWNRSLTLIARVFGLPAATASLGETACNCIADECSQWCWLEDPGPRDPEGPERDTRGFCGRNVAMAMKVFGP